MVVSWFLLGESGDGASVWLLGGFICRSSLGPQGRFQINCSGVNSYSSSDITWRQRESLESSGFSFFVDFAFEIALVGRSRLNSRLLDGLLGIGNSVPALLRGEC